MSRYPGRIIKTGSCAPAGASAAYGPFTAQTRAIRISATAAVNWRVGDGAQTAVNTDPYIGAGVVDYVLVGAGQSFAAIGTATVTLAEMQ